MAEMTIKESILCFAMLTVALGTILFVGNNKELREIAKKEKQQLEARRER